MFPGCKLVVKLSRVTVFHCFSDIPFLNIEPLHISIYVIFKSQEAPQRENRRVLGFSSKFVSPCVLHRNIEMMKSGIPKVLTRTLDALKQVKQGITGVLRNFDGFCG